MGIPRGRMYPSYARCEQAARRSRGRGKQLKPPSVVDASRGVCAPLARVWSSTGDGRIVACASRFIQHNVVPPAPQAARAQSSTWAFAAFAAALFAAATSTRSLVSNFAISCGVYRPTALPSPLNRNRPWKFHLMSPGKASFAYFHTGSAAS
eukprot:514023-Prymnesium_polylepis.1